MQDTDKTNLTQLTKAAIQRATEKFSKDDYANMPALKSVKVNIKIAHSLIQKSLKYALLGTNVDGVRLDSIIVDENNYNKIKSTKRGIVFCEICNRKW